MKLPTIPLEETRSFLVDLLKIPSPTGDTEVALAFVAEACAELPLEQGQLRKGGLLLSWPGDESAPRALTAHVDTLGVMVRKLKDDGRLQLTAIGGFDWHTLEGEGCTVVTGDKRAYRGSILPTKASVHIYGKGSQELKRIGENYEVRLDVRTEDMTETRELGIQVGDFVYIDRRVEINEGFIRSRYLDDKAGVAAIYGALLALQRAGLKPRYRLDMLISGHEEVGHGAATGWRADVTELIAVDMAAAGGTQNSDQFSVGICAKDSGGPYHLGLRRRLEELARRHEIPYRVDIYPHYGSDGEAAWRAGADFRVGLIGPGVDASHAYERTHSDSIVATAQLIVAYLLADDAD